MTSYAIVPDIHIEIEQFDTHFDASGLDVWNGTQQTLKRISWLNESENWEYRDVSFSKYFNI